MPSSQPKTDHVEEARRLADLSQEYDAGRSWGYIDAGLRIPLAQAHASIAIAQELRGIREALEPAKAERTDAAKKHLRPERSSTPVRSEG